MNKKTRNMTVHPAIIMHLIERQAGTLGKAILELIMNSVDAGAEKVSIKMDAAGYEVYDDGSGFKRIEEIEQLFEVLGFPHEENDHRTYGAFGIGRAQQWAFASTVWRTGDMMMDVNVRERGMEYDLVHGLEHQVGCAIFGTFYEPKLPSDIAAVERELTELAAYCPIPVTMNGKKITKDIGQIKWDIETEDAYIKVKDSGSLSVYNLGIKVRDYPGYLLGTGGIIVSKQQLDVNFARNDVLVSRCEVWKRIRKTVQQAVNTSATKKKAKVTDDMRARLVEQIVHGEIEPSEVEGVRLVKDARGRYHSLAALMRCMIGDCGFNRVTMHDGAQGTRRAAELVHINKVAFVLHSDMGEWASGVDTVELCKALLRERPYVDLDRIRSRVVDFAVAAESVNSDYELINPKELSKRDRAIMKAMTEASRGIAEAAWWGAKAAGLEPDRCPNRPRRLMFGRSEQALAWTDGDSYIAIDLRHARKIGKGLNGVTAVASTLLHEYCHDRPSNDAHDHDLEFYEIFHNASAQMIGKISMLLMKAYIREAGKAGVSINQKMLEAAGREMQVYALEDGTNAA